MRLKNFVEDDELCFLPECNFRRLPPASSYDDELAAEPWFHVNEGDIFPEEFTHFLGLSSDLKTSFTRYHGDLFATSYWRETQERLKSGEMVHIFPYRRSQRLHT